MPDHDVRQGSHEVLLDGESVGDWSRQAGKESSEAPSQNRVAQSGAGKLHVGRHVVREHRDQYVGVEIEHSPSAGMSVDGIAVVHLAGIDRDDVTCRRLDRSEAAPGVLGARIDDADAELVVSVARK